MAGYSPDKMPAMQKRMIEAMQAIPGVNSVGLVDIPPLHMGWSISHVFNDKATDLRPANAARAANRVSNLSRILPGGEAPRCWRVETSPGTTTRMRRE